MFSNSWFPLGFGRGSGRITYSTRYNNISVHSVNQSDDNFVDSTYAAASLIADLCSKLISYLQQQMNIGAGSSSQQQMTTHPPSNINLNPPITDPNLNFSGMFSASSFVNSSFQPPPLLFLCSLILNP